MAREREAFMPPDLVRRVLECATPDVVLVGGQALAYWMAYFDLHEVDLRLPAISRDVDFFTADAANAAPLGGFARAISGTVHICAPEAITALIGHAEAPAADDDGVYNVDLIHAVVGLTRERIDANAVSVVLPGTTHAIRVMHPLDVLQSRNANLHTLAEKQNDAGRMQLRLAIDVARAHLDIRFDALQAEDAAVRERAMFDEIAAVHELSDGDAAKKNVIRHGLHVADAIPAWRIVAPVFWEKQWPHLRQRMSAAHAARCEMRRAHG